MPIFFPSIQKWSPLNSFYQNHDGGTLNIVKPKSQFPYHNAPPGSTTFSWGRLE